MMKSAIIVGSAILLCSLIVWGIANGQRVQIVEKCKVETLTGNLQVIEYKGHEYFYHYNGILLHAEHCECKANLVQRKDAENAKDATRK